MHIHKVASDDRVGDSSVGGLAVLLTWTGVQDVVVSKCTGLLTRAGWDVAVAHAPRGSLWVPAWAAANARTVLDFLLNEVQQNGPRPVIFLSLSGANKAVYSKVAELLSGCPMAAQQQLQAASTSCQECPGASSSSDAADSAAPATASDAGAGPSSCASTSSSHAGGWLRLLKRSGRQEAAAAAAAVAAAAAAERYRPVLECLCGQVLDSMVDFTSEVGSRLLAREPRSWRRAATDFVAASADFLAFELIESQRGAMWGALRAAPSQLAANTMLVYCWQGDELADPQSCHALGRHLRDRGCNVLELALAESEHASHITRHEQEYQDVLQGFLEHAHALWAARQSGAEQQQQQQQQQAALLVAEAEQPAEAGSVADSAACQPAADLGSADGAPSQQLPEEAAPALPSEACARSCAAGLQPPLQTTYETAWGASSCAYPRGQSAGAPGLQLAAAAAAGQQPLHRSKL